MNKSLITFTSYAAIITLLLGIQFFIQQKDVQIAEATNIPEQKTTEIQNRTNTANAPEAPINANAQNTNNQNTANITINSSTKIPILMYHAVGDGPNDLYMQTNLFEQQIQYLWNNGYNFITFEDLKSSVIPNKSILITFDDGYKDVYDNAYPILNKYNVKATIFLISKTIDSTSYLSRQDISEMNNLISFQSHTVSHLDLSTLNLGQLEYEIKASKEAIQNIVKNNVIACCYPYGKYSQNAIDITKKYYNYGISTLSGFYTINDNQYIIKRIRINKGDTIKVLEKKLVH